MQNGISVLFCCLNNGISVYLCGNKNGISVFQAKISRMTWRALLLKFKLRWY